jgi:tetratricopeptide (TPR) repeat protein
LPLHIDADAYAHTDTESRKILNSPGSSVDVPGLAEFFIEGDGANDLSHGNYEKAISDYSEAIKLDPKGAQAYNGRGIANYQIAGSTGDSTDPYDKAIKDFNDAIRLNPNNADAYHYRGMIVRW